MRSSWSARSLAKLDFAHSLDSAAIRAICHQRRPGSAALRWAIDNYEPLFAHTQSPFEDDYIVACETLDIPKPDRISVRVLGIPSDAVYEDAMVIVELDGIGNHHSPAQIRRDHRNDKALRDAGLAGAALHDRSARRRPRGSAGRDRRRAGPALGTGAGALA